MLDLLKLRKQAEVAGEQHRRAFETRTCIQCGKPWPCDKAWEFEPEIPGETVIELIDRIGVATDAQYYIPIILDELQRARKKHTKPFNSAHEGYAVILEELDEVWEEIKRDDLPAAQQEMVQVAAMALRFLVDTGADLV